MTDSEHFMPPGLHPLLYATQHMPTHATPLPQCRRTSKLKGTSLHETETSGFVVWLQACHQLLWDHLQGQGLHFHTWYQWSDNCACQFKCSLGFWLRSKFAAHHKVQVVQHFFCAGHGKGLHDAEGGTAKAYVHKLLMRSRETAARLLQVQCMVEECQSGLGQPLKQQAMAQPKEVKRALVQSRQFFMVSAADIDALHSPSQTPPRCLARARCMLYVLGQT